MNNLERRLVLQRLETWLGPELYDARFGDSYCRVFERVLKASLGTVPESSSPQARLDHVPARWATFVAVADATVRSWTVSHRAAERRQVAWPSRVVASRIPEMRGAQMRPRLDLNSATASQLADVPGIGKVTARRIVARRSTAGFYTSVDDLRHVEGLAKAGRDEAAQFLDVASRGSTLPLMDPVLGERDGLLSFPAFVRRVHAGGFDVAGAERAPDEPAQSAPDRALTELQRLADHCGQNRVWASDRRADVSALRLAREAALRVEALTDRPARRSVVGIVRNSAYLSLLLGLIERAHLRVFVQMFFLTSTAEGSPGDRLLDALVAASARGVAVRLIIDADLEDDPHGATRVNSESLRRLDASGLSYRLDDLGTTSHTKAVLVDDAYAVIGSHNWTNNGMYGLDETSLFLENETIVAEQLERFERLWKRYDPDPDRRDLHFSLVAFLRPFECRRLAESGFEGSRAFLDQHLNVQSVRDRASSLGLDAARLEQLWRILKLVSVFGFPEATAFALTLTPVDSPTEFRRVARKKTLEYLRHLELLPEPYSRQRIRFDVVEAADG